MSAVSVIKWMPPGAGKHAAELAGTAAAAAVIAGMGLLAIRRVFVARVRATTSPVDWVALVLLGILVVIGTLTTLTNIGPAHDYRQSISLWFRGLFNANPDIAAAQRAPVIFQLHAIAAWVLIGVWPFTRLVHAWSYPLWYLWRPYVVYRRRVAIHPHEPGTSGRRWRRIGVRY